jgi:hypothetical protein
MRRPSTFKKSDVVRVMNAVQAAGLEVARVEVRPDGLIVVVPRNTNEGGTLVGGNEWDELLNGNAPAEVR